MAQSSDKFSLCILIQKTPQMQAIPQIIQIVEPAALFDGTKKQFRKTQILQYRFISWTVLIDSINQVHTYLPVFGILANAAHLQQQFSARCSPSTTKSGEKKNKKKECADVDA